jgi:7-cyano-7-deazaguanine synthase
MPQDNEPAVVILSGGLDSTTLLYYAHSYDWDVHALTFLYGQKHSKEVEYARHHCEKLQVKHRIVDVRNLADLLRSALINPDMAVPDGNGERSQQTTVVPGRNAIFLSIATGYAGSIGARNVFYGAHASDFGVYPDCRPAFVNSFEQTARLALDSALLQVRAPFLLCDKAGIVRIGNALGIDFARTWTCYRGGEKHCGTCNSCRERRKAFSDAQVEDRTEYAE